MRNAFLFSMVLLVFGSRASAQHLGELSVDYSYMHYVPVDNLSSINMNGGGVAAVLYFAGFLGIKAEVEDYASKNLNFSFPPGSVVSLGLRRNRVGKFIHGELGTHHKDTYKESAAIC
jgi:hypothetical protein